MSSSIFPTGSTLTGDATSTAADYGVRHTSDLAQVRALGARTADVTVETVVDADAFACPIDARTHTLLADAQVALAQTRANGSLV